VAGGKCDIRNPESMVLSRVEIPDPVVVLVARFPGGVVVHFQLPSTPGVRFFPGTALSSTGHTWAGLHWSGNNLGNRVK
jgi:hypothetical protein